MEEIQNIVSANVVNFKKVYSEILSECIARRKNVPLTQKEIAEIFEVDPRKISDMEAGKIMPVGLLLKYADLLDIETNFIFIKH